MNLVVAKCNNCKGAHVTASKACLVRKQRAQALALKTKVISEKVQTGKAPSKKPASVTFTPSFEDFPEAQQAQQSLPATEATPKTKLTYASASHSSTTAKSTTPATNTDKQNAQPTKPVHQQKATSTSAVRDTPANSKPSTLKVPTTIQEDTETTETYTQLLEMLFAQIEQLKPLLIARKETTRNIVSKILASIQEL